MPSLQPDPFAWPRLAFTGSGGSAAVRALVLAILTERSGEPTEIVIQRPDAEELLGIGPEDLVNEQVPGLTLVEDFSNAVNRLRLPGPRRICLSCRDDVGLLNDVLAQQPGRAAVISFSPWRYESAEVDSSGAVTAVSLPELLAYLPETMALLDRAECFGRLMELPTVAKSEADCSP